MSGQLRKAIAIDFDGCLCECAWPGIGAPNMEVINAAIQERANGAALILWTCRAGSLLESAVEWCRGHGLEFDAVNENLPERIAFYETESRKVSADEYWDDHAVRMGAGYASGTGGQEREKPGRLRQWLEVLHGRSGKA